MSEASADKMSDDVEQVEKSLEQGFPRSCLLSNCYLKKPKMFTSHDELNKHLQRCMPKVDSKSTSPATSTPPARQGRRRGGAAVRGGGATAVPLGVRLDYERVASITRGASGTPSSSTPSSSADDSGSAEQGGGGRGATLSGGGGDGSSSSSNGRPERQSTLSWRNTSGGGAGGGAGGGRVAGNNADNGRLQWSASLSVGTGKTADTEVLGGRASSGRHGRSPRTRHVSNGDAAGGKGVGTGAGVAPGVEAEVSTDRRRGGAAGSSPSRPRAAPVAAKVAGKDELGSITGGDVSSDETAGQADGSPCDEESSEGGESLVGVTVKQEEVEQEEQEQDQETEEGGGQEEEEEEEEEEEALEDGGDVVVVDAPEKPAPWRGSLGEWRPSGGFTCPVNPVEAWGLPGCGKESRARDTKCDSCGRYLRVEWHVGASASVGSGVENPELKLAGVVTFQNKNGLTYKGRVVAIDPRPREGSPRGRVRVKYDDWPYDKYDEDTDMEMVTPFGWVPTPVGRAGRRASKPVVPFTPATESQYPKRVPAVYYAFPAIPTPAQFAAAAAAGHAWMGEEHERPEGYRLAEEETSEEEEEEEEEAAPVVKVWQCKHVRKEEAENYRGGACRACFNAAIKSRAGISMCKHVREGEARAYGRGPGNYGKGHCRECTIAKFPVKKIKVPKPRLWPSCVIPECRRRHSAWGMCAACLAIYKEKHPQADPPSQASQAKRKNFKAGFRYMGEDAEFTDSSDDENPRLKGGGKVVKFSPGGDPVAAKAAAVAAVAAVAAKADAGSPGPGAGDEEQDDASRTSKGLGSGGVPQSPGGVSGGKGGAGGKKRGAKGILSGAGGNGGVGARQGKRAKMHVGEDAPICFYCQKSAGRDAKDQLLLCADFDCTRSVHMKCCSPSLDKVPERFYCPLCIDQEKDKACENPCMACGSNDRDDLILVCDRDTCYCYFHCYCLPQPLEAPPEGEYVCPSCTGDDLERGLVIAKRFGGTRPPRLIPAQEVEGKGKGEEAEQVRRCSSCRTRCVSQAMWKCCSGKEMCKGKSFHRKCLARGKARPAVKPLGSTRSSRSRSGKASAMEKKGGEGGVVGSPGRGAGQEVRDAENNRLCCPVCGYDLLEVDVVDVLAKEKTYEGTAQEEETYKTFERALRVSLEDPRFGIGMSREQFEEPFKGSIGSGANRTAMYGSVFEAAVDEMFRQSKLTSDHKFLDIGCGIGSIVLQAAGWAGCQAAGIEIVEDRFAGAVTLHEAFVKTLHAEKELGSLLHPKVVENNVHLYKGCFLEQWDNPGVRDADFIFFNNSSGWFNNSKALNNPDEHSLEARLLSRLKNDSSNNGKILITLEHIAEWQPDCWERRTYKYNCDTRRAATYAANELEFWEYTVVSQWECPGCTSLNTDAVNDCIVCGTYCRGKRNSKRL